MRIKTYLKNEQYSLIHCLVEATENSKRLQEGIVPDFVFNAIKSLGTKLGLKIKRADSIFDYLSRAEEEVSDLVTFLSLYAMAKDPTQKEELKSDIKKILNRTDKKELANFFMILDKAFFGFSSMLRNVLMAVFGIEITTYKERIKDIEFIEKALRDVRRTLLKMHPTQEEIAALDHLDDVIAKTKKQIEVHEQITGATSGATTTDNVEKYYPKLGPTTRRRKKNRLKRLL